ncbi:MAG TPA: PA2779 family protein [Desulfobacterales bacterium]
MKRFRLNPTPICVFLTVLTVYCTVSAQPTLAGLIGTQAYLENADSDRDRVVQFLAKNEVRKAFVSQGVDPQEAADRVQHLSEKEIRFLAQQIDQLPAGGDGFGFVIGVLLIVLLVLLILRVA